MKEEKYISLELAKKIAEVAKERGVKLPESEYYRNEDLSGSDLIGKGRMADWMKTSYIPAYDTYELLEIFPDEIDFRDGKFNYGELQIHKHPKNKYLVGYRNGYVNWKNPAVLDKNIVEQLGKMLLYLLKNDLLKTKTP